MVFQRLPSHSFRLPVFLYDIPFVSVVAAQLSTWDLEQILIISSVVLVAAVMQANCKDGIL